MNKEEISKVVMVLIGKVRPVGDSAYDEKALENLEKMLYVTDDLIDEIQDIANKRYHVLGSVARSGEKANGYIKALFKDLKEELKEADDEI